MFLRARSIKRHTAAVQPSESDRHTTTLSRTIFEICCGAGADEQLVSLSLDGLLFYMYARTVMRAWLERETLTVLCEMLQRDVRAAGFKFLENIYFVSSVKLYIYIYIMNEAILSRAVISRQLCILHFQRYTYSTGKVKIA